MKLSKAIDILEKHNNWLTKEGKKQVSPKKLSKALGVIILHHKPPLPPRFPDILKVGNEYSTTYSTLLVIEREGEFYDLKVSESFPFPLDSPQPLKFFKRIIGRLSRYHNIDTTPLSKSEKKTKTDVWVEPNLVDAK